MLAEAWARSHRDAAILTFLFQYIAKRRFGSHGGSCWVSREKFSGRSPGWLPTSGVARIQDSEGVQQEFARGGVVGDRREEGEPNIANFFELGNGFDL